MSSPVASLTRHNLPAAVIPTKSLSTDKVRPIVYVQGKKGFEARVVSVEARNPDDVAVKGIEAGTLVVLVEPDNTEGKK